MFWNYFTYRPEWPKQHVTESNLVLLHNIIRNSRNTFLLINKSWGQIYSGLLRCGQTRQRPIFSCTFAWPLMGSLWCGVESRWSPFNPYLWRSQRGKSWWDEYRKRSLFNPCLWRSQRGKIDETSGNMMSVTNWHSTIQYQYHITISHRITIHKHNMMSVTNWHGTVTNDHDYSQART